MNLPSESNKPSPNQLSSLAKVLKDNVGHHWLIDESWSALEKITIGQYRYILMLVFNGKRAQLNKVLLDLGFKRVPLSSGENYVRTPKNKFF